MPWIVELVVVVVADEEEEEDQRRSGLAVGGCGWWTRSGSSWREERVNILVSDPEKGVSIL